MTVADLLSVFRGAQIIACKCDMRLRQLHHLRRPIQDARDARGSAVRIGCSLQLE